MILKKSYASNYPVNHKNNKYVNLEFAYLVELSKIDMYFRKIILGMCLDVEHVLKTRMLYDISRNAKEDGYNIVKKYFFAYPATKMEIIQKANSYNFTSDLAEKMEQKSSRFLSEMVLAPSLGLLKKVRYNVWHIAIYCNGLFLLLTMIEDYIDYYSNKRLQRNLGVLTPMEKHEKLPADTFYWQENFIFFYSLCIEN